MLSFEELKKNKDIKTYIMGADKSLAALGYTEHSFAHVANVADRCEYILSTLERDKKDIELAKIAAHLHDIGNVVNRIEHSQSGAIMAFRILDKLNMPAADIATIISAIGNHDEGTGVPVDDVSAALILADKSDVRRSRVRKRDKSTFDIHDRVNYSVKKSELIINDKKTEIRLILEIDTRYGNVMEYFEIFMERMLLCRRAAEKLDLNFKLVINNNCLL